MNKPEPLPKEQQGINDDMKWSAILFAREVIYEKQADQIVQAIEKAQDKEKFIGKLASDLVSSMVRDAAEKNSKFNRRTVQEIFKQVILDIVQLAAAKGVMQVSSEKQAKRIVNAAFLHSSEAYARVVKSNRRTQGVGQAEPQQPSQSPPQQPPAQPNTEPKGLLGAAIA